ncbi:hypothetical protein [Spirillospora albida]|uniref:hypothetical protein n=1 Tax=Spirillospora albida TaxID=58123 RepID=UPI0004C0D7CF|nr:hypothetical protein [Spirillospora albida]
MSQIILFALFGALMKFWGLLGLAGTMFTAAVAGCGAPEQQPVKLPPAATPAASPTVTPEDQVKAAYLALLRRAVDARALPDDQLQSFWHGYLTADYLKQEVRSTVLRNARGEKISGSYIPRIKKITVTGASAIVRDCQDARQVTITNAQGKTLKLGDRDVQVTFVRSNGVWLASSFKRLDAKC